MLDKRSLEHIDLKPIECVSVPMDTPPSALAFITRAESTMHKIYYAMKCVNVLIQWFGMNFVACILWIDQSLWIQSLSLGPQCYEVVVVVAPNGRYGWTIVVPYINLNKAVSQWLDLWPVRFWHLRLYISHVLHAHPENHSYAQGYVW